MSIQNYEITVNDSLPSLQYTLSRSGSGSTTPNLEGCTATLKVRELDSTSNSFSISITTGSTVNGQITDPTGGVFRFDFSTDKFPSSGTSVGEISFANSAGKVETAPDRQLFVIDSEF